MASLNHFVHPFAEVALSNITREYPYASHHLARSLADIVPAAEKNPAFANSYDWHSSVHMHYLLVSLLDTEEGRNASWRDRALEVLTAHLNEKNILVEADFLRDNPSWERPYGWAWAVELNRVLNTSNSDELRALGWRVALAGTGSPDTWYWISTESVPARGRDRGPAPRASTPSGPLLAEPGRDGSCAYQYRRG